MYHDYQLESINDIMRLNIVKFLNKMDNPKKPIFVLDGEGYRKTYGKRVYVITSYSIHYTKLYDFQGVHTEGGYMPRQGAEKSWTGSDRILRFTLYVSRPKSQVSFSLAKGFDFRLAFELTFPTVSCMFVRHVRSRRLDLFRTLQHGSPSSW